MHIKVKNSVSDIIAESDFEGEYNSRGGCYSAWLCLHALSAHIHRSRYERPRVSLSRIIERARCL